MNLIKRCLATLRSKDTSITREAHEEVVEKYESMLEDVVTRVVRLSEKCDRHLLRIDALNEELQATKAKLKSLGYE